MPTTYATISTKKFLDFNGLSYFAQKLNQYPTNDVIVAVIEGMQDALDEKVDLTDKGAANGVADLDSSGLIPVSELPDDVYDVLTYTEYSLFPLAGEDGKVYIDKATNAIYRWDGSAYVRINPAPTAITNSEIDALFE